MGTLRLVCGTCGRTLADIGHDSGQGIAALWAGRVTAHPHRRVRQRQDRAGSSAAGWEWSCACGSTYTLTQHAARMACDGPGTPETLGGRLVLRPRAVIG